MYCLFAGFHNGLAMDEYKKGWRHKKGKHGWPAMTALSNSYLVNLKAAAILLDSL